MDSAAALLATRVTGREGLLRFAGEARPVTDDQPRIEYAPWVRPKEITRVLPELLSLREPPPLQGADEAVRAAIGDEWRSLRRFYGLVLHAYNGNRAAWAREAREVVRNDGNNPYYRWFIGGGD
ncbi:hypothetical protein D3C76_991980 [compost metagenome]